MSNLGTNAYVYGIDSDLHEQPMQVTSKGMVLTNDTDAYAVSDIDTAANQKYYGFLNSKGNWYIMNENTTAGSFRYALGATGYTANWAGRSTGTYSHYDGAF